LKLTGEIPSSKHDNTENRSFIPGLAGPNESQHEQSQPVLDISRLQYPSIIDSEAQNTSNKHTIGSYHNYIGQMPLTNE
jgi:hypothetical protein